VGSAYVEACENLCQLGIGWRTEGEEVIGLGRLCM
jgi:hypothetical protein